MKTNVLEEFYYNSEKIEKDTLTEILDVKEGFSRTGVLVKLSIETEKETIEDWMDVGIIFPLNKPFVLPRETTVHDIEEKRKEIIDDKDDKLFENWKSLIKNGEKEKVIKHIYTKLNSDKFGL